MSETRAVAAVGGQYTTMPYDRRHLIIKTTEGREPVAVPEHARLICELQENNKTREE